MKIDIQLIAELSSWNDNISFTRKRKQELEQRGISFEQPGSLLASEKRASSLTSKVIGEAFNFGKNPTPWVLAGEEAPEQITDLTAKQVRSLWAMVLEMNKPEQCLFIRQLPPDQLYLLTLEQLAPVIPQLTGKQIWSLKSVLSNLNQDEVKMMWAEILKMTSDERGIFVELLKPHNFSLLTAQEIAPVLTRMTRRQIESLNPDVISQLDPEDIFAFMSSTYWSDMGLIESRYFLTPEQFKAVWTKILGMEPEDRKCCLRDLSPRLFASLSVEEIGTVLGELARYQVQSLNAEQVKQLYPWILKMERVQRILLVSSLRPNQLTLWDLQERVLLSYDLTLKELENLNLDDMLGSEIALLQPNHIKKLYPRLVEIWQRSGGEPLVKFDKLGSDQLALLGKEELTHLLFSGVLFSRFKPECIKGLWKGILRMEKEERSAFIGQLNPSQLSLLSAEELSLAVTDLRPVHIEGIWSIILRMDEIPKHAFIKQMTPNQFSKLSAVQILPVLYRITPAQIQSFNHNIITDILNLYVIFSVDDDKSISALTPERIKEMWPKILNMDLIDRLRLLSRLPSDRISLLNTEDLAPVLSELTKEQIQSLNANQISELWPKILLKIREGDKYIRKFVNHLLPRQLVLLEPSTRRLVKKELTLEEFRKIKPDEIPESQICLLSPDYVKALWPDILQMEERLIVQFIRDLRGDQLMLLREEELDLLVHSKMSEYLFPNQLTMLWPVIVNAKPDIRKAFINNVALWELNKTDLTWLLHSDSAIGDLDFMQSASLGNLILDMEKGHKLAFLDKLHFNQLLSFEKGTLIQLSADLTPIQIKRMWAGILGMKNEIRIAFLWRLQPEQLSLLEAADLAPVLGEMMSRQIKNLNPELLKEIEPYIAKMEPLDRIYFINSMLPWQRHQLDFNGIPVNGNLAQEDIGKIKFGEIPRHQLIPKVIKQLCPHLIGMENTKRKTFLSQLISPQLSLLVAADFASILSEMTQSQIRSLNNQLIQELWPSILKMNKDGRVAFLNCLQPGQLSLLEAGDLVPVLGVLTSEQIKSLKADILTIIGTHFPEIKALDRVYFINQLTPQQTQQLASIGIVVKDVLTTQEITEINLDEIPIDQIRLLKPELMKQLWPRLEGLEDAKKSVFVRQLSANQLFSLEEDKLVSVINKLTAHQVKALFPKLLAMKGRMEHSILNALQNSQLKLNPQQIKMLSQKLVTMKTWLRNSVLSALQNYQFILLNWEERRLVLSEIAPEEVQKIIHSENDVKELWLWMLNMDPGKKNDFIPPVLNALKTEQIGLLLEDFGELWPWTLKMEEAKRNALFELISPEYWPLFFQWGWIQISKMEETERSTLFKSILSGLGPKEVKALWPWILKIDPAERKILIDQLRKDQLILLTSEDAIAAGVSAMPLGQDSVSQYPILLRASSCFQIMAAV